MHDIFEKFADVATQMFFSNEATLNDAITKIAKENDLNTEQIKRVVESANTKASLQVLDESEDRLTEFDVAEPAVIIKAVYDRDGDDDDTSEGCGAAKTASFEDYSAPYQAPVPEQEKVAAEEEPLESIHALASTTERPRTRYYEMAHLEKVAADAMQQGWEAYHEYDDNIEKLAQYFSQVGTDLQAFEDEAIAFMGIKCAAELGNLRKRLGMPVISYAGTQEKVASDRKYTVIEVNDGLRILGGLVEKRAAIDHNLRVSKAAEAKLADVRKV